MHWSLSAHDRSGFTAAIAAIVVVCAVSSGMAASTAVLVGQDLEPQVVTLQALRDGELSYFDADRNLRREPISRFLQIREIIVTEQSEDADTIVTDVGADSPVEQSATLSMIELRDGQRLTGKLLGGVGGQMLQWEHPLLGRINIRLDDVAAVQLDPAAVMPRAQEPAADVLLLANGDRLEGFVMGVDEDVLRFQPMGDRGVMPLELPIERISSVILANPPVRKVIVPYTLHLADGSRFFASDVQISGGQLQAHTMLDGESAVHDIALGEVRRIDIASTAGMLVDLVGLTFEVIEGGNVFTVPMMPRRVGTDIQMHAPVKVRFQLPPGAGRFACDAYLASRGQEPIGSLRRGQFVVRIYVNDTLKGEYEIGGRIDPVRINVPIDSSADKLIIELDPGPGGPVLDRLLLHNPVLLVSPR